MEASGLDLADLILDGLAQRFHLHRKRPGQLVERPFRTVLLGDVAYLGEAAGKSWWP